MWLVFEQARWDGAPTACVCCGVGSRVSLLSVAASGRRVWRCAACRSQFSVLAGTVLERTRAPLSAWLAVLSDVVGAPSPGSSSARELSRRHGLTPVTARLLRGRLLAAGVRAGDPPDDALRRVLQLPAAEVARVRRAVPARRDLPEGPSASLG